MPAGRADAKGGRPIVRIRGSDAPAAARRIRKRGRRPSSGSGLARGSRLGVVFRRQVVIGNYIADFAASSVRLVVEVDGGSHHGRERLDAKRDARLARAGWRVVRVSSEEALEEAVAKVAAVVRA